MPRAWRITKAKYAKNAFDGDGARRYGTRWTSPGIRVAFAAESLSLATLEIMVHLQKRSALANYVVFTVDFPDELVRELDRGLLPDNWREFPAPPQLQALGDEWIRRADSVLLRVPSVIVVHEHNFLINPAHDDFSRLATRGPLPLEFDPRLFKR